MKYAQTYTPNTKQKTNPYRELCHHVLLSAYKDLHDKTPIYRRKARSFFTSGKYKDWTLLAGIDPDVAYQGYLNVLANGMPERGVQDE